MVNPSISRSSAHKVTVIPLGRTGYRACWELQRRLHAMRCEGAVGDLLLLTEHDAVFTLGSAAQPHHLLADAAELRSSRIELVRTDRGGGITYHGPGQLVGYPILDLHPYGCDLHRYLRMVEESIIVALETFGVAAGRLANLTGVWVGGEKICAIGIRVSRWVTMHGFALNVSTDLSAFTRILPCGISDRGVTSLTTVLGREVGGDGVGAAVCDAFARVFDVSLERTTLSGLVGAPVMVSTE